LIREQFHQPDSLRDSSQADIALDRLSYLNDLAARPQLATRLAAGWDALGIQANNGAAATECTSFGIDQAGCLRQDEHSEGEGSKSDPSHDCLSCGCTSPGR
jgi:hypothetical protein